MDSIWYEGANLPRFERLEKNITTDVLIIGGGLCGILTAYLLDKEGIDYVLLDAGRICRQTTANTTAKITSQHGLIYSDLKKRFNDSFARMYYEANENAAKEYESLCADIECDYKKSDSYVYSRKEDGKLEKEIEALTALGIPFEYLENCSLPFQVSGAIRFENQACFNPLKFVSQISQNLNIYENSRVVQMLDTTAITDSGRVNAKKVVVATHFPFINKHGLYFLKMFQERSYVLALENAKRSDGMYIDAVDGGLSIRDYGKYVLLGGFGDRTGKGCDGMLKLKEAAQKYYPESKIKYEWATQDCMTLDGVPYIGKYSMSSENLYVATGFNKWGMTSSMVSAQILSDMLIGKKNKYEKLFSPSRSILHPQLLKNTFEALCGWLSFDKKRCPHLGCALHFNKYEHTWDCSCHGSRFDEDGRLINNPANSDLKK